ncbi:MAG: hypothetical protein JO307_06260 [Bryobacterales bacterium]|nr:hypothetical protein [Bryobacterales bacterium]MBV9397127.1 hypothetical protein [Bryobacterales bacterium]
MKPSKELTEKSAPSLKTSSINTPEFHKSVAEELKDWVQKGHLKLAKGNTISNPPSPKE